MKGQRISLSLISVVMAIFFFSMTTQSLFVETSLGHALAPINEGASISSYASYPNSEVASLWVRRNGSDPGFDFSGANVSPSVGMNYFGTNVIQVTWSYNWTDINNTSLFPLDCEMYIQSSYDSGFATVVANHAVWDSRIKGIWIDDFEVGKQSPANMSAIYTNLKHEDANLTQGPLTLGIVVYQYNYPRQAVYTWADIEDYFDIIHFWYYPTSYGLLYPQFAGYENDFMTLRSWLPDKEYWLGIYLHYYNIGSYPEYFTYDQMSAAGKLMKLGYAARYSILENFWIQHNLNTAELVKDFINNEYQKEYSSLYYYTLEDGPTTVFSYTGRTPLITPLITFRNNNLEYYSHHLQNFTIDMDGILTQYHFIYNMRTGIYQYPYYEPITERLSYILEPDEWYDIMPSDGNPLTEVTYPGDCLITAPTVWDSKHVVINGVLNISADFSAYYCIIEFGPNGYEDTMYNHTRPDNGLYVQAITGIDVKIYWSLVQPTNRAYPYFFERAYSVDSTTFSIEVYKSVISCYSDKLKLYGDIEIKKSTFYQTQPIGSTYTQTLRFECPSLITNLWFEDNLVWNYDMSGKVGVFLMAYNLQALDKLRFLDNTIVGGNWGLWMDMLFTSVLLIEEHDSYCTNNETIFTTFRLDGSALRAITITTSDIFEWTVKATLPGMSFTMSYPEIANGLYTFTADGVETRVAVTTGSIFITYVSPWSADRNSFTFGFFGIYMDTEATTFSLIWLLIIFIIPVAFVQVIPKYGYLVGVVLSLLIIAAADTTFVPYMLFGFFSTAILAYRGA